VETLVNDLRHALRLIRRHPGLTSAVLLTLALGIGANTAVFSVVHAVLLRPLPYGDPERLVLIWEKRAQEGVFDNVVSPADYLDWVRRSRSFAALGGYSAGTVDLTGAGDPVQLPAGSVTPSFFDVLGVRAALGRTFRPGDERTSTLAPVVIGHGLWRDRFGSRADIIGHRIELNGKPVEIVGVLPREFEFLPPSSSRITLPFEAPLLWTPLELEGGTRPPPRAAHYLFVYGRLAAGISLNAAADEMDRLGRALEAEFPNENRGHGAHVVGLHEQMVGRARGGLLLITAGVAFLLLIGCTNVASLLLAQSVARRRELAVRAAVGAGRGRLLQQSLTESLVLSGLGGVAGLFVAWGTVRLLVAQTPPVLSGVGLDRASIDLPVLGVAALLVAVSGVLAGALPAWHAGGDDPVRALNAAGRSPVTLARGVRLTLIAGEIALTVILLVGAGLMLRSFGRVLSQPPGFEIDARLTATIQLPASRYPDAAALRRARAVLDERLSALPGVIAAGATNMLPLSGSDRRGGIVIEGQEDREGPTRAHARTITPPYIRAAGLQLMSGRTLTDQDSAAATPVVLVNETMARRYWPGQEALGRRVRFTDEGTWLEIVGVVRDVKHWGLDQPVNPELYIPYDQRPAPILEYVLHTTADPASLGRLVAADVLAFDRQLPVSVRTFEAVAARSVASHRWSALLLSLFAGLGILLAGAGVYGVMAHLVAMRTGEIGVRLTLGARPAQVLRQIMIEALGVAAMGAAIGLAVAVAATRTIRSMLFGIEPTDPLALAGAAVVVLIVTAIAASVPAIRAMRIDPVAALRQ
jgi:putative ABC transport system permease protein